MKYDVEKLIKSTGSVGAYAKEADDAFRNLIRKTSFGDFDRIDWQFINCLNNNQVTTKSSIIEFLSFLDSEKEINNRITKFESKSIISFQENQIVLTSTGKIAFEEAYEIQKKILQDSFEGISEEDYRTCIMVLKRMIENMKPHIKDRNEER